MASETISATSNWNALTSAKAYNEVVTIDSGAILTLDQTADAQGIADAAVGVGIVLTSGFSTFRISNNSPTLALQYAGPELGSLRVETGSKFEVRGQKIVLQSGGSAWQSSGAASQTIPGAAWTALYAAANEPSVIFVETGNGTGVYEPWLNAGALALSNFGAAALGKWFSYNTSTGAISFGDAGAALAGRGGAIPPNGARVQVYNIGIGKVNSGGTWGIHATPASNFETDTDAGGIVDLQNCYCFGFWLNAVTAAQVLLDNVGSVHRFNIQTSKIVTLTDCYACVNRHVSDYALYMRSNETITMTRGIFAQENFSESALWEFCQGASVVDTAFWLANRNSANDNVYRIYRSPGFTMEGVKVIGGRLNVEESPNVYLKDTQHSDSPRGVAFGSLYSQTIVFSSASSSGGVVDGFTLHSEGSASVFSTGVFMGSVTKAINFNYPSASQYVYNGAFACFMHNNNFGAPTSRFSNHGGGDVDYTIQNSHLTTIVQFFNNSLVPSRSIFKGVDNSSIPTNIPGCSATHFYEFRTVISPEAGKMGIFFTPKAPGSAAYSIVAGTVSFDLQGRMFLLSSDAEIIYEWPHWVKGITAFPGAGTLTKAGTNPNNFTIQYDIDLGSGYSGSWATLSMANLAAHTINPAMGFKLKIRITRGTSAITDSLNQLNWDTTTDYTTYKYPEVLVAVTIRNLKDGARYWLKNEDSGEVLALGTKSGDGDVTIADVPYNGSDQDLTLKVRDSRSANFYLPLTMQGVLTETGADFYVSQLEDALAS